MNEVYMYKGGAWQHSERFQLVSEILPLWFLYLHLIGYRGTGNVQFITVNVPAYFSQLFHKCWPRKESHWSILLGNLEPNHLRQLIGGIANLSCWSWRIACRSLPNFQATLSKRHYNNTSIRQTPFNKSLKYWWTPAVSQSLLFFSHCLWLFKILTIIPKKKNDSLVPTE